MWGREEEGSHSILLDERGPSVCHCDLSLGEIRLGVVHTAFLSLLG